MKKKLSALLFLSLLTHHLLAQEVNVNSNTQKPQAVVNNVVNYNDKPLYVDGEFNDNASDSELDFINNELNKQKREIYLNKEKAKKYNKLQNSTGKLADATEEYVEQRQESEKLINEYNEKIKCIKDQYMGPGCEKYGRKTIEDKVIIQEAAPSRPAPLPAVVEAPVVSNNYYSFSDKFKVFLGAGVKSYVDGGNFDTFDSNVLLSLSAESELWDRLSLGLKFDYTTMNFLFTEEFRSVESSNYGLEFYGKFYLLGKTRFKPYIGAGIGLNRFNMQFRDGFNGFNGGFYNNYYNNFGGYYGNNFNYNVNDFRDNYVTNNIQGSLKLGAEFILSPNVGFYAGFNYLRSLTNFGGDNFYDQGFFQGDREVLQLLHSDLVNAHSFSLQGGVIVSF